MYDPVGATLRPLVLVVNGDAAMRGALQFMLQMEGAEVQLHKAGGELLANRELPRADCLIMTDRLPDMDAFEILESLCARKILVPAILLTSHATDALRARAIGLGCRLVLQKPVMDNALIDGVRSILNGEI
jgi:FixJ family two-component response regulator